MAGRKLRMGMVGGGRDAFIGAVHRAAARLDDRFELVAGALSSDPERARASALDLGLAAERAYGTWNELLEGEKRRPAGDRIEVVSIVTPNSSHHEIARAAISAGFHVVCDKPMVTTLEQAADLERQVARRGVVFCVTYNYTGYPMVKHARAMVQAGEIGVIRKVVVEYHQGWLATKLEATGQKQADWRTDPARAGAGGAIGDIGSHAENLVSYVTGLEVDSLCADLSRFVPGRQLDDDAAVLLRFRGGVRGILSASQVCVGRLNDLRLRVWGTTGGLMWHQEDPNELRVATLGGSERILHRGDPGLAEPAQAATRLPVGHPEAFIEAFANVYRGAAAAITSEPTALDYPGVRDGARGVRFIHAVVASSDAGGEWVDVS